MSKSSSLADKTGARRAAEHVDVVKTLWDSFEDDVFLHGCADTAVAGRILAGVEITWPDGRRETAPNAGWIEVLISQDIA